MLCVEKKTRCAILAQLSGSQKNQLIKRCEPNTLSLERYLLNTDQEKDGKNTILLHLTILQIMLVIPTNPRITSSSPSQSEITEGIKQIPNGKADGIVEIPIEIYK